MARGGGPFDPRNLVFLLQFGPRSKVRSSVGQNATKTGHVGFLEGNSSRNSSCFLRVPNGKTRFREEFPAKYPTFPVFVSVWPTLDLNFERGPNCNKNRKFGGSEGTPQIASYRSCFAIWVKLCPKSGILARKWPAEPFPI